MDETTVYSREDFKLAAAISNDNKLSVCGESHAGDFHFEPSLQLSDHSALVQVPIRHSLIKTEGQELSVSQIEFRLDDPGGDLAVLRARRRHVHL